MKKITSFLYIALLAMTTLSLTSCDEDHEIAMELDGTWEGTVRSNNGDFIVDIRFWQDGLSRHGDGYEYDQPMRGGRGTYARFTWSVNNSRIFLNYDDGSHIVIDDYSLNRGWMTGYLTETRSGWAAGSFSWKKIGDNRYDDGYFDSFYYWTPQKPEELKTDSIE